MCIKKYYYMYMFGNKYVYRTLDIGRMIKGRFLYLFLISSHPVCDKLSRLQVSHSHGTVIYIVNDI